MRMRGKGHAVFLKSIMRLYIKYPLQSLGATLIIVIILNLYNHQEYVEPILFTIIFGGGLLLLSYIGYHYFIKTKNSPVTRNKEIINNNNNNKEKRSYRHEYNNKKSIICQKCGKEFVPVKNYKLCFNCRKKE